MSISYETEILTQSSVYNKSNKNISNNRELKVYFSLPELGVDENTGLLIFIAGFGGQASSKVYKKMRDKFSDKYNLVTIQCDYFGYEFMQEAEKIINPNIGKIEVSKIFSKEEVMEIFKGNQLNFTTLLDIGSKYDINVKVKADLSKENLDNFNDMGILQAIDNISAVLAVMNILYDNNYIFNSKKVILYGHSHGAYLAYLCNAYAPKLFSLLIDNSAWLYPVYLFDNYRCLVKKLDKLTLNIAFDYLAKKIIDDAELYDLRYLYSKFQNNCNIISYHGVSDDLISCYDKSNFCKSVDKCIYNEISQREIDDIVFKSTNHGLDSDFLEMFDYTIKKYNVKFKKDTIIELPNEVTFITRHHKYVIDYSSIFPKIKIL